MGGVQLLSPLWRHGGWSRAGRESIGSEVGEPAHVTEGLEPWDGLGL